MTEAQWNVAQGSRGHSLSDVFAVFLSRAEAPAPNTCRPVAKHTSALTRQGDTRCKVLSARLMLCCCEGRGRPQGFSALRNCDLRTKQLLPQLDSPGAGLWQRDYEKLGLISASSKRCRDGQKVFGCTQKTPEGISSGQPRQSLDSL